MKMLDEHHIEVCDQVYENNNCKFSTGFVDNRPPDTMYLMLEKDNEEPTIFYFRPDEMAIIAWLATGILWSSEMKRMME